LTDIPSDFYLLIAGPNDSNITEWEGGEDRDIKIRIPNPHHPSSDEHITLSGHRDQIAEVREKIEALYQKLKSTTASATVDVPRAQHRFLIGDRGDGIKALFVETGCAVIVPPLREQAGDKVVIRSERSKVGPGIGKVLERASEVTLVTVDLTTLTGKDKKGVAHARNIYRYARRQNLFSKLAAEGVNLSIPKPSTVMAMAEKQLSIIFEIDGKDADAVFKVESALKSLVKSLPAEKFDSLEIDPCLHGILIGKKGAGLQSIKDQFNVYCLFENQDEGEPEILLVYEGNEAPTPALSAAKDHMNHLASTIPDIEEQTLHIPRKYHKIIVGPNGTTLNALIGDQNDRATRVNVYVGGKSRDPEKQEDIVIVRGPSKDMQRVVKNINDHVSEAKHTEFITSHVEEFTIPVDYSKNIIGKGGKRIQELRERFGVQIKVDEGKVHIQGVKKNAEEAKKVIQSIVNELKDDTIERIPVKNIHHGHLIGEKGTFIMQIKLT
jgi:rRNA processing protein Krr1/Pno1